MPDKPENSEEVPAGEVQSLLARSQAAALVGDHCAGLVLTQTHGYRELELQEDFDIALRKRSSACATRWPSMRVRWPAARPCDER